MSTRANTTLAGPGQIAIDNRDAFLQAATETIASLNGDAGTLVLDLAETKFIDTAGLGTMALIHRQASEAGVDIQLINANDEVVNSLALARLDELFELADSDD